MLYEAQLIFDDQVTALQRDSKTQGTQGGEIDFALLVDGLAAEREQGITADVVIRQLDAVLQEAEADIFPDALIAYEPVWAIGTGLTASEEQAQEVHALIRARLALVSGSVAEATRILYGGSVKPDNAAGLFAQPDIDGGLIGGASLKATDFLGIISAAAS